MPECTEAAAGTPALPDFYNLDLVPQNYCVCSWKRESVSMRTWDAMKEKWQNFLDSQLYWKYVKKTFFVNSYPHSEIFASATQQTSFACTPDTG